MRTTVPAPSVERSFIVPPCRPVSDGDREAQARAVIGLGELALDLLERPAELSAAHRGRCRYRCPGSPTTTSREHPAAHRDACRFGRELDRVGQKIDEICLNARRSAPPKSCCSISAIERELLLLGAAGDHAQRSASVWIELDLLQVELDAAGLDLRHVEDVVDDVEQVVAAASGCRGNIPDICRSRARRTSPDSMIRRSR